MNQNLSEAAMNWNELISSLISSYQQYVSTDPYEEVNHEENVESQVNLLSCVLQPRNAGLHIVTAMQETQNKQS